MTWGRNWQWTDWLGLWLGLVVVGGIAWPILLSHWH